MLLSLEPPLHYNQCTGVPRVLSTARNAFSQAAPIIHFTLISNKIFEWLK
jgi:hypothetical protein